VTATLEELKEAYPWVKTSPNTFLFDIGIPGGTAQWTVIVDGDTWRVRCDENERGFGSEDEACTYFWERLMAPPSTP